VAAGENFSRNLKLDENGLAVGEERFTRRNPRNNNDDDDDDEEEEEEEEEEEDDSDEDEEGDGPSSKPGEPELTRAERRELKKKQAEVANKAGDGEAADGNGDEDDLIANPNRITKKLNISDLSAPRELTRREREQKEKKEAKDRYWKLHAEGKTDQAKADLSRLAEIRAKREAAAARRKAEAEEKAKVLEAAKAAQSSKR